MTSPPTAPSLVQCENEPIHIPGSIQPFGILLSVESATLTITNASVNCSEAFGLDARELVNRSLAEHLSADALQKIEQYIHSQDLVEQAPLIVPLLHAGSLREQEWEVTAHLHHGVLILELEPLSSEDVAKPLQRLVRNAVHLIFGASRLIDLCQRAAEQVRLISGYDRVMIYRFTEDWHGDVIAETTAPHAQSYLHHHFPASDIPAQARKIFLDNWMRMIPDVAYTPVTIYPGRNATTGAPLDLGMSALRSVSPLHIEYLQNMGVGATLTLPLIDNGKLWGLIACHHLGARTLGSDQRLATKMIAQLVSSQLALKESLEDQRYRNELKRTRGTLLGFMEESESVVGGLAKCTPNLLDLVGAGGGGAAVFHKNTWITVGATPSVAQIDELVEWLATVHGSKEVYASNQLSSMFAPASDYQDIASGLLAIAILKSERNYVLWFRPEVSKTITWAGQPDKRVEVENGVVRLHPRFSFDSWKQVVNGIAAPWKKVEVESAAELRTGILGFNLRRAFAKAQKARALAEKISGEKETLVHIVSHDIRNPLSVLKMSLQFMERAQAAGTATSPEMVARSMRAVDTIERLVTSVLDSAKSDHVTLSPDLQLANAGTLVRDAVDLAMPLAEKAGIDIGVACNGSDLTIACKRAQVEQVLGNLISNALKFTPAGGRITVSARQSDGEVVISVADTGMGIAPALLPRIFDRFTQGTVGAEKGAGLGLSIVKGIIEQEGGRIWVESSVGVGTTFHVTLPRRQG